MTTSIGKPVYRVAVLIFSDADILDFAGPIECLSHTRHNANSDAPDPIFFIQTVCRTKDTPIATGGGTMLIQPIMSIAEMLDALDTFHVLIVPGGPPEAMEPLMKEDTLELNLIKKFASLHPREGPDGAGSERVLMSVCTGALLLASAGILKGIRATTHHLALGMMQEICDGLIGDQATAEDKTDVVGDQRFVDAGSRKGMRILTAGGVSSGLDASLYLVELMASRKSADFIGKMMEYSRVS